MQEEDNNEEGLRLTPIEARILGSLMEKELTTPDNYPLTMNSLMLACNQKTNREPAMNLSLGEVGHTVNQLTERKLLRIEYGERANRIVQRMNSVLLLNRKQQAIVAVLMLRGPQTLNDIRVRTERMAPFDGIEEIQTMLDDLMDREPPLAVCIPRGPGRREDRFSHLLCGPVVFEEPVRPVPEPVAGSPSATGNQAMEQIDELMKRVATLEDQVARLVDRLNE